MGGVLIIISIVVPTLLWADLRNRLRLDRIVRPGELRADRLFGRLRQDPAQAELGLTAKAEIPAASGSGADGGVHAADAARSEGLLDQHEHAVFQVLQAGPADRLAAAHPWYTYPLAFAGFYAFMVLVVVGSSNAVNLTDGLDGLAIGLMVIAAGALTVLTYVDRPRAVSPSICSWRARRARRS